MYVGRQISCLSEYVLPSIIYNLEALVSPLMSISTMY